MDPTPAPAALPQWQFAPQWRVLPGMAHGSRQPVMLGHCDVHIGAWDGRAWDQVLADLFPQAPAPAADAHGTPEQALVRRLLFWAGVAQRHHKVPVFDAACIWCDPQPAPGWRVHIAMPYASAQASRIALHWVTQAALLAMRRQAGPASDADALAQALLPFQAPGYNTIRFLQAAHALDMPWRGVVPGVIAYGQGHGSRWFESSYTDQTPVLGTRLARDKARTAQVLRQLGLPAPTHARATSPQQAVQLAQQIGYPVVVKPADRDQGQGVHADLHDDAAVLNAFAGAARCSGNILVEKHAQGRDYRLTVLCGRLIKTVERRPAGVVGDGRRTVAELVDQLRQDPGHRRDGHLRGHAPLELDGEARGLLAQRGQSPLTVPADGEFVALRRRANVSAGGTPHLVQDAHIHPDNRRLAERAAQAVQLDLAGVDLIIPDIGRSWLESGALICEVNGQPQLGSSTTPGIYRQVLRELVPAPWRKPIVLVLGHGAALARELHARLLGREPPWGLSAADGVWEGGEQVAAQQRDGFAAARILAASRCIGGAIVAMAPEQLLRDGLPFDRLCLLVVAADGPANDAARAGHAAPLWRMVLPHVEGDIVCTQRLAPSLRQAVAPDLEPGIHVVEDGPHALASTAWSLLAQWLGLPAPRAEGAAQ